MQTRKVVVAGNKRERLIVMMDLRRSANSLVRLHGNLFRLKVTVHNRLCDIDHHRLIVALFDWRSPDCYKTD